MDAHVGAEKASGVLASSQGNAFRAVAPGAKAGEFAKPAPVVTNTAAGANAGKENATTTRGAAAAASTSGEPDQPEKRWQVRDHPKPFDDGRARASSTPHAPRFRPAASFPFGKSRKRIPLLASMRVSRDAAATARERHPPANARRNETDTRAVSRARGCFFGIQETDLYPPRSFTSPPVVPAARECRATTAERFRHRQASGPR
jgi:hypothetical protein